MTHLNLVQFNVLLRPGLSKLCERRRHIGHVSCGCHGLLLQAINVVVDIGLVHHPLLGLLPALGKQLGALAAGLIQRVHHLRAQVRRHGLHLVLALQRVNVLDLSAGIHEQLQGRLALRGGRVAALLERRRLLLGSAGGHLVRVLADLVVGQLNRRLLRLDHALP